MGSIGIDAPAYATEFDIVAPAPIFSDRTSRTMSVIVLPDLRMYCTSAILVLRVPSKAPPLSTASMETV